MDAAPQPAQHPDPASGLAETARAEATPPRTGHLAVDAAVSRLAEVDQSPLERHAEVFDEIHRALSAVLEAPLEVQQART